ncbi:MULTISPECIES: serine hydrolase [unclassified Mesobacillus]|uniref:serine hydrolase n=1 Tax=unclassified Mesobacillus TaxID=2675270 RepID=UPI002040AD79|nr:class A beta-lactamase-related serine hydrolase [Mesobacillus sp. MER 33]MCM3234032.1 class A beta-lactamase-related serine hydrolase [Mesobacillus sp. MER 48]
MYLKRVMVAVMILFLLLSGLLPVKKAEAATLSSYQNFNQSLSKDLKAYMKKSGGNITLHYREFSTGDEFKINSTSPQKAASTIKLPLALYVMELAAAKKINLNEKLTYKKHHYYGGSGVIKKQKLGTKYTIRDLVKKSMVYSDNIAFIMLREKVGKNNFTAYMKKIGGKNAYPKGQNLTSSADLVVYANRLYNFSRENVLGQELVGYLKKTVYNTTIPKGIKGTQIAHKVGMIPESKIYNDIGIVYDKNPFALAVMTNKLSYSKSQKVIADIASIVYKHHKSKNKVSYVKTKKTTVVYPIPILNFKQKFGSLAKGESFKISADKGSWYEIQYGGKKGYIYKRDVYAYSKPPISGLITGTLKNNGWVKAKNYTKVLNKPAANGKVLLSLYKGTSIYINSLSGSYYKALIGNRVGYVHKDAVELLYSDAVKYFEVTEEGAWVSYRREDGVYVRMGFLKKGQVFSRTKDAGAFNEVQIGTTKAYVNKNDTKPLFSATIINPAGSEPAAGQLTLNLQEEVYSRPSGNSSEIIGKFDVGQVVSYIRVIDGWYEIKFLGRKVYIKNPAITN